MPSFAHSFSQASFIVEPVDRTSSVSMSSTSYPTYGVSDFLANTIEGSEPVETVNALPLAVVVSFDVSLLIVFIFRLGYSAALPLSMLYE